MTGGYSETILPFGKFREQAIGSVPNSYLSWLLKQDWFEWYDEFDAVQDEMAWRKDNSVYIED